MKNGLFTASVETVRFYYSKSSIFHIHICFFNLLWKEPIIIDNNILEQDFEAEKPDEKYVGDITYVWTDEGWLYLACAQHGQQLGGESPLRAW